MPGADVDFGGALLLAFAFENAVNIVLGVEQVESLHGTESCVEIRH